jgi:lipopolysaccharide biosynthesis glycosyltransferase
MCETPIRIVLSADEDYAVPVAVAIRSLLDCRSPDSRVEIYILDGGISDESKRLIVESCDGIPTFLAPASTESLDHDDRLLVSRATFLRLQIPALLPHADRAIYLDSDVLVLEDLTTLWATPLRFESPLGAVLSMLTPRGHMYLEMKGFGADSLNFNSGVLLMDLQELRRSIGRAEDLLRQGGLLLGDQDALNLVYENRWTPLAPRWNCQVFGEFNRLGDRCAPWRLGNFFSADEVAQMRERPAIVHFTSATKPWHLDSDMLDHANRWLKMAEKTAFGSRLKEYRERQSRRRLAWTIKRKVGAFGVQVEDDLVSQFLTKVLGAP